MRIAHVVTACAALITAFRRVETVHLERRPESGGHLAQPKTGNVTDVSEITFTTLRPEATSFSQKALWNIYLTPKQPSKGRPYRSMTSGPYGPNRSQNDRRRRQLHRLIRSYTASIVSSKSPATMAKVSHGLGRSMDVGENHLDHQQLEPVQPAEAFEKGAIRIEPIYRVTKNKNILDSLIGIVKRLIDPPKSAGPLVGPFNFPGVGDKVYIRLLEPVDSGHLVIRLVTNLPGSEIDASLDPGVLPAGDLLSHAKVPSVSHESLALADALTSSVSSAPHSGAKSSPTSDSSLASSNSLLQVSKSSSTFGEGVLRAEPKNPFSSTYEASLKSDKVVGVHGFTGRQALNQQQLTMPGDTQVDWSAFSKAAEQRNRSQEYGSFQYPYDQSYQFYPALNDSGKQSQLNFEPAHGKPAFPLADSFSSGFQVQGSPAGPVEDQPRYSLEFASKKMRYLNLDGSVESAGEGVSSGGFRPLEQGPVMPKVTRSVNLHWEPFKKMNSGPKEAVDSSAKVMKDHRGDDVLAAQRRSSGGCIECLGDGSESSEEQVERSVNNSTTRTREAKDAESTLELLQLQRQRQLDSLQTNSTKERLNS